MAEDHAPRQLGYTTPLANSSINQDVREAIAQDPPSGDEWSTINEKIDNLVRKARSIEWYGWRPSPPDHRDHRFVAGRSTIASLPARTENYLGHKKIPIYNQLNLGSCTANGVLRAWRIVLLRTIGGLHYFDPSRLAHYYWTRALDGSQAFDAGAYIRDAMKILGTVGVAPEALWPYIVDRFAIAPPAAVVAKAAQRLKVEYLAVEQTANQIKGAIAQRRPVVFGMTVYESTDRALEHNGVVPVPGAGEAELGGHCLVIEDYDDVNFAEPVYLGPNSWGDDVGLGAYPETLPETVQRVYDLDALRGYVAIPQRVLHNPMIADDFWTIKSAA